VVCQAENVTVLNYHQCSLTSGKYIRIKPRIKIIHVKSVFYAIFLYFCKKKLQKQISKIMSERHIKLSEWAKRHDYSYYGAYDRFKRGELEGASQDPTTGTIFVELPCVDKPEKTVVYTRVSSSENKSNLDTQAERVAHFCAAKGWKVSEVIKECASGLNDQRPKLTKLLKDKSVSRIVVEHKDRLTRFGFNYIQTLLEGECEIVVINEVENDKQDLLQDFVSLVTSFCARLYSKRRTKRKTERLIKSLEEES
jgi:predicted site-specific integrase-resolvase